MDTPDDTAQEALTVLARVIRQCEQLAHHCLGTERLLQSLTRDLSAAIERRDALDDAIKTYLSDCE